MSKVEALEQVLVDLRLTRVEKFELAQWLQQEDLQQRWTGLFARIDRRLKRYGPPPSDEEIVKLCRHVRRERYERSTKCHP